MFEKLFEELAKILFVLAAFVAGMFLVHFVPASFNIYGYAWESWQNVTHFHTEQSYILLHQSPSPNPTP